MILSTYVANNFLKKSFTENVPITPMKLQRLVYFLYKEYLKRTNEPLFSEEFQTWTTGPVLPSLYAKFGCYGTNKIKNFARDARGKIYCVTEDRIFKESIDKVWALYGHHSGTALSELMNKPYTAWGKAIAHRQQFISIVDIKMEPELYVD